MRITYGSSKPGQTGHIPLGMSGCPVSGLREVEREDGIAERGSSEGPRRRHVRDNARQLCGAWPILSYLVASVVHSAPAACCQQSNLVTNSYLCPSPQPILQTQRRHIGQTSDKTGYFAAIPFADPMMVDHGEGFSRALSPRLPLCWISIARGARRVPAKLGSMRGLHREGPDHLSKSRGVGGDSVARPIIDLSRLFRGPSEKIAVYK
jgi:hypothetical protein